MSSQSHIFEYDEVAAIDFVLVFPPELSNTLFSYCSDRDLFSCCECSVSWRNIINNDQQWTKRCLVRGWTQKYTLNEAVTWKDRSHMQKTKTITLRPTPEFTLESKYVALSRLHPPCDWALYFRQRLHVRKNWTQGIYTVHKLIVPEAETESLIMNCSACNGKYFVFGTTLGFVFIWNVSDVPALIQSIDPIQRNLEVLKVFITSQNHLVLLYERGLIRVFQEADKPFIETVAPFRIIYQAKVLYNFSDDTGTPSFQLECFTQSQISLLYNNSESCSDIQLWNNLLIQENLQDDDEQDFYEDVVGEDVLFTLNNEVIMLTAQNSDCFIIWDLESGQNRCVHFLPCSCRAYQVLLSNSMCIFSVLRLDEDSVVLVPKKYGIVIFDLHHRMQHKMTPEAEVISPKVVDEMSEHCSHERFAFCSQEGVIGAFSLSHKELLFITATELCVDNLTSSDDLIFYHESEDRLIVALSWTGEIHYKIAAHIGPVKSIRCFGLYMVSGGAVRELIIWEKRSGKKLHTVYHQPNHIIDLFVSPTSILTVGRDEAPAMIGYL